jgi:predicted membrane channel-forming protein YqfA (hemolysin III family)
MAKIGLVIFVLIVGLALGGIIQEATCDAAKQDLGTGTSIMGATCKILSIPIDLLLFLVGITGAVIYYIKTKE